MEHQDWTTKILNSNKSPNQKDVKKQYVKSKEQKMKESEEEGKLSHKKMDLEFGKSLQKYRLSQGLTQKDIAQKLNIPLKDINEIESGKMKHNGQIMGKIKRLMLK
jgi:ribosome-binding protein aMBF1 (putative translation factor)